MNKIQIFKTLLNKWCNERENEISNLRKRLADSEKYGGVSSIDAQDHAKLTELLKYRDKHIDELSLVIRLYEVENAE